MKGNALKVTGVIRLAARLRHVLSTGGCGAFEKRLGTGFRRRSRALGSCCFRTPGRLQPQPHRGVRRSLLQGGPSLAVISALTVSLSGTVRPCQRTERLYHVQVDFTAYSGFSES